MPFKSKKQRAYMHINHPEIAKRWEREHHGKQKREKAAALIVSLIEKKAELTGIQHVGAGVYGLAARFGGEGWQRKLKQLRERAQAGDSQAGDVLSMVGLTSIALGTGLGTGIAHNIGHDPGGRLLGAGLGAAVGAAPALFSGSSGTPEGDNRA